MPTEYSPWKSKLPKHKDFPNPDSVASPRVSYNVQRVEMNRVPVTHLILCEPSLGKSGLLQFLKMCPWRQLHGLVATRNHSVPYQWERREQQSAAVGGAAGGREVQHPIKTTTGQHIWRGYKSGRGSFP